MSESLQTQQLLVLLHAERRKRLDDLKLGPGVPLVHIEALEGTGRGGLAHLAHRLGGEATNHDLPVAEKIPQFAGVGIEILDESCWYPHAENVYKLGTEKIKEADFADPLTLLPHYLRGPQAVVKQRT